MREVCRVGEEKMGRMSSKRIPGEGKLGYCRREERREDLRTESSSWSAASSNIVVEGGRVGRRFARCGECEGEQRWGGLGREDD